MPEPMGTFRIDIAVENPARPGRHADLRNVLVDTGAELSWVPADTLESRHVVRKKVLHFRQADGSVRERSTGYAILHVAGTETTDEVVFGEPGDLVLLGARTLEGLNLRVDPLRKTLVDAGPAPAAVAASRPCSASRGGCIVSAIISDSAKELVLNPGKSRVRVS
jgi:predicted aspartyl protease